MLFFGAITLVACGNKKDSNSNNDETISEGVVYGQYYNNHDVYVVMDFLNENKNVTIKSSIKGKPVTAIADSAFKDSNKLEKITIPSSVEVIEKNAFNNCDNLKTVNFDLGSSLKKISLGAFAKCDKLESFTIPSSVEILESGLAENEGIFYRSKINTIVFEQNENLTELGSYIFNNSQINYVDLTPTKITKINSYAFKDTMIENIQFNNSLTSIMDGAFEYAGASTPAGPYLSITIPKSVEYLGSRSFASSHFETVVFESGSILREIPNNCFEGSRIKSIKIPKSVTKIGHEAFSRSLLETVEFEDESLLNRISARAFFLCEALLNFEIPSSVKYIGNNAFYRTLFLEKNISKAIQCKDDTSKYVFLKADDWWCSEFLKRSILGYNGTRVNVSYDDCNPFGMIVEDFGKIDSLSKHTSETASNSTITAFNTLSALFTSFMDNFKIPTNDTEYIPTISGHALSDYTSFYNKAIEIYNSSLVSFTKNLSNNLTRSAVIGVNYPYTMAFGTDINPKLINFQTVIANLFGFSSKSEFMNCAQNLADTYAQHRANIVNSADKNEALENGCFYASNGSFIFPIAVKNELSSTVLAYVILDTSGLVSVWVNDITAVLWATNFNSSYHTNNIINNELYCKNILFVTGPNLTDLSKIENFQNVTVIADNAFSDCEYLSVADMSGCSSLITIGNGAFSTFSLESVIIPNCVLYVGVKAFSDYENLRVEMSNKNSTDKWNIFKYNGEVYEDEYLLENFETTKAGMITASDVTVSLKTFLKEHKLEKQGS